MVQGSEADLHLFPAQFESTIEKIRDNFLNHRRFQMYAVEPSWLQVKTRTGDSSRQLTGVLRESHNVLIAVHDEGWDGDPMQFIPGVMADAGEKVRALDLWG